VRYGIAVDGNRVSPHFGRCERYEVVEIEGGKILRREALASPGHEPGLLPGLLNEAGADCIVCGGAGPRAVGMFEQAGIEVILGVSGPLEEVVQKLAVGEIAGGDSTCEHGEEGIAT